MLNPSQCEGYPRGKRRGAIEPERYSWDITGLGFCCVSVKYYNKTMTTKDAGVCESDTVAASHVFLWVVARESLPSQE